jgi:diguanylate cyclase (GGDEF)-like protein/PAS domain S-box-containing protein
MSAVAPDGPGGSGVLLGHPAPEVLLAAVQLSSNAIAVATESVEGDVVRPIIEWTNPTLDRLLRYRPGNLIGAGFDTLGARLLAGPGAPDLAGDPLAALVERGGGRVDVTLRRSDASPVMARVNASRVDLGSSAQWILDVREIEAERRADEELRASEARFRALAVNAPIGIFASEVGLRLGYVNERTAELLGRPVDELLPTGWMSSIHEDDLEPAVSGLTAVLAGEELDLPIRIPRPGDEFRWLRMRAVSVQLPGRGAGLIGSLEDITKNKRHEEALAHQAMHDPLTGLPNRTMLRRELATILNGRRAGDGSAALLFFDLDNFKLINDSLGHTAGDALLVSVAHRLSKRLRAGDIMARFGGDEFVVLCKGVDSEPEAMKVAERMLRELSEPFDLDGNEVQATASVGVVLADDPDATADTLVRDADVAMYQAKESGRARCAIFDEDARQAMHARLMLANGLRRAMERDELSLAYQPVVDLGTGRVASAEALLRWTHPTRGPVPPAELIELAEETGDIMAVGAWVLRRACAQLAAWRMLAPHAAPQYVSVNLSAHQLRHGGFVDLVSEALSTAGLKPADLCLELTESVLMTDSAAHIGALAALRDRGVLLAIDDFGTGYSSLAYLKRVPVDFLKVDRHFVAGLGGKGGDAPIVSAIVQMARALGLPVVAEGVETREQLDFLVGLRCAYAQGYLLGRPMTADSFAAQLLADGADPSRRPSRRAEGAQG